MESRAKFAGHAIHPMLIVFPLGLLAMALIFDIIHLASGATSFAAAAFWDIAAGVIMGLLAAAFGFVDWLAIPEGTRAKQVGLLHGGGNVVIVVLFAISWLLRIGNPGYTPSIVGFILEIIAVLLALGTGWLGGELVERLGVGVDPGANVDAPRSLAAGPPGSRRTMSDQR